jgi:hypothetical protein
LASSGLDSATTSPTPTVRGDGRGMRRTTSFSTAPASASAARLMLGAIAAPAKYMTVVSGLW